MGHRVVGAAADRVGAGFGCVAAVGDGHGGDGGLFLVGAGGAGSFVDGVGGAGADG